LGSHLIAFAEERILRESPNIFMCVSSFNEGARQLYQRLGYQVVGELTDYIVQGHSEILLRKTAGPLATFTRSARAELARSPERR
jgi:ribosomal-protein-alanine N-acetyltransferase